ncbi:class I SAM-dependent methyltransferase [Advenella mimigardefordensis]|uniref:S-adenosyl-L-methionine-dependent methyltransferase n=1 Tax=Advenella mimigardefordensis (strain DSM 17166 / LMG 22922 / DPN7) TaxID=1247726 RepID=W0PAV8_ADVMD|nr:SAM-dependent methyltransferase [Advenella mimigardefordensis]AHG62632.1 hypothetical protein MIM_c05310 [Advenella mimigardefordensis DPN7]
MRADPSGAVLPQIQEAAQRYSENARHKLAGLIYEAGPQGLPFARWMQAALYDPRTGYYAGAPLKFGDTTAAAGSALQGDFVTAPELTPWFGRALARQISPILTHLNTPHILEFGAGSGALAEHILQALLPDFPELQYFILDISPDLTQRQKQRLAPFGDRVQWLHSLPTGFTGCIIANEVLDAMPVTLFEWGEDGHVYELHVINKAVNKTDDASTETDSQANQDPAAVSHFDFLRVPANALLDQAVRARMPALPGYRSEINLQGESWVAGLGQWLDRGVALLIDYGFPAGEYYHPQRSQGTLMCHLLHHAHSQVLHFPGIQDITAHVDFTAMADAALAADLEVLGYTSQARFLLNCGLLQMLSDLDPTDTVRYTREIGPVQKLLSEAEMGELFKVLAVGKNVDMDLDGFATGDRRHRL